MLTKKQSFPIEVRDSCKWLVSLSTENNRIARKTISRKILSHKILPSDTRILYKKEDRTFLFGKEKIILSIIFFHIFKSRKNLSRSYFEITVSHFIVMNKKCIDGGILLAKWRMFRSQMPRFLLFQVSFLIIFKHKKYLQRLRFINLCAVLIISILNSLLKYSKNQIYLSVLWTVLVWCPRNLLVARPMLFV